MVSFALSDEQQALRDMTAKFVADEVIPRASHHDETGEYPFEIARKAFELGLLNITVPEQYGGGGLGHLEEAIITEQFCYGCAGTAISMTVNNLATVPLVLGGGARSSRRSTSACSPKSTAARATASPSRTRAPTSPPRRPPPSSKAIATSSTATRRGSPGGAHASWFLVFAYTDREKGHEGMSAFVVPADTPGIKIGKKEDMMGQRASNTVFIQFEDVAVPADHCIGGEGQGFRLAMQTFDRTRPGIAAAAVGVCQRAFDESMRYAKERHTFGKPIAEHQAIQFMLADMAKDTLAARLLTWHAAWKIDQGERNTLECSIAKCFGADAAMRITTDAVQIFGGYGYSKEFPVEKLMRDAKILQIYEGTNQVQRMIIARQLLR